MLAPKGHKNVYNIVNNNEKANITVLVTANAAGNLAPTFVVFAGKSLPNNAAEMAPSDFAFGFSENGWMLSQNFYEYIANVFEPWLTKNKIKRPVILYINGHCSHMTLHLSRFCLEHNIVLIALHPNATHITQPLDVSLFWTLKAHWVKSCEAFCKRSLCVGIHKYQFARLLKRTLDSMNMETILQNGFRKSGLYPFDVNAIDFSKVIRRTPDLPPVLTNTSEVRKSDNETIENKSLKVFESFLTESQVESFRLNTSSVWRGIEKDEGLFDIWFKLSHPMDNS